MMGKGRCIVHFQRSGFEMRYDELMSNIRRWKKQLVGGREGEGEGEEKGELVIPHGKGIP